MSKKLIALILALLTFAGCSRQLEVMAPNCIPPDTIEVTIPDKTLPLKDLFLESYLNKEETQSKEEENVPPETEHQVQEELKQEENKQVNEQVKPPKCEEEVKPKEPIFTEVNETVYAISDVNIRKGPGTNYEKVGQLKYGENITRVGIGDNGWSKVIYKGEKAYISSNYLTKTKPVIKEEPKVEEPPKEENTKPSKEEPYNVMNSKDSYKITKYFTYGKPTISEDLKQYALDMINIIDTCNDEKYIYTFEYDTKGRRPFDIMNEISSYIDDYYDPMNDFIQIVHNGVFSHKVLEDGKIYFRVDICPGESRAKIEKAKTAKKFIVNAANSISLNGNKVHDLKAIHDYICKKASYDDTYNPNLNSIYSLATTGKTKCAGYASAFKEICNYVGMNVKYISGTSDGELHAWNSVKIDGTTYYIDVTWDDSGSSYKYFLITKEELKKDHNW